MSCPNRRTFLFSSLLTLAPGSEGRFYVEGAIDEATSVARCVDCGLFLKKKLPCRFCFRRTTTLRFRSDLDIATDDTLRFRDIEFVCMVTRMRGLRNPPRRGLSERAVLAEFDPRYKENSRFEFVPKLTDSPNKSRKRKHIDR